MFITVHKPYLHFGLDLLCQQKSITKTVDQSEIMLLYCGSAKTEAKVMQNKVLDWKINV